MTVLLIRHGGPAFAHAIQNIQALADVAVIDCDSVLPLPMRFVEVCQLSADEIVEAVRRADIRATCVMTFLEQAVPLVAAVAKQLRLPALDSDTAHLLRDRIAVRQTLKERGFQVPQHSELSGANDLPRAAEQVGYPLLVRPAESGHGALGVRRVNGPTVLAEQFRAAREQVRNAAFARFFGDQSGEMVPWMVESDHAGVDVTVTVLGHSERPVPLGVHELTCSNIDGESRIDRVVNAPLELTASQHQQATATAARIVRALGLNRGVFQIHLRATDSAVYPVLIQPVPPAGATPHMIKRCTGYDVGALHLRASQQVHPLPLASTPIPVGACAAQYIYAPSNGTFDISGLDEVRDSPGVLIADAPHDRNVAVAHPYRHRLGLVVTHAATPQAAVERLDSAMARLHIVRHLNRYRA